MSETTQICLPDIPGFSIQVPCDCETEDEGVLKCLLYTAAAYFKHNYTGKELIRQKLFNLHTEMAAYVISEIRNLEIK
jgi:hypothetical protein